jgi:RNA exonuclease 1
VTTVAILEKGGLGRTSNTGPQDSRPGPGSMMAWKGGSAKKMPLGKLVEHKTCSLDEGAPQDTHKLKKRSQSHTELFGAESEEEDSGLGAGAPQVWPPTLPSMSSESESDSNSSLRLDEMKFPSCLKASPPVPPATPSSLSSSSSSSPSSGASQCAEEDVDYSALEKEVDFHVDPMEECLRIFTESTSVKMEDKDPLAQQPPKEKAEEKMHAGLTTSFPGQKRRVLHLCELGKGAEAPKKTPVAPTTQPPTAQEVWYLRAQQALRELAIWLQAAPGPTEGLSSVHISVLGEKQRIAHVPNPRLAAALTGSKRAGRHSICAAQFGRLCWLSGCQATRARWLEREPGGFCAHLPEGAAQRCPRRRLCS